MHFIPAATVPTVVAKPGSMSQPLQPWWPQSQLLPLLPKSQLLPLPPSRGGPVPSQSEASVQFPMWVLDLHEEDPGFLHLQPVWVPMEGPCSTRTGSRTRSTRPRPSCQPRSQLPSRLPRARPRRPRGRPKSEGSTVDQHKSSCVRRKKVLVLMSCKSPVAVHFLARALWSAMAPVLLAPHVPFTFSSSAEPCGCIHCLRRSLLF